MIPWAVGTFQTFQLQHLMKQDSEARSFSCCCLYSDHLCHVFRNIHIICFHLKDEPNLNTYLHLNIFSRWICVSMLSILNFLIFMLHKPLVFKSCIYVCVCDISSRSWDENSIIVVYVFGEYFNSPPFFSKYASA